MSIILDRIAAAMLKPVNEVVTAMLGVYTVLWGLWVVNPWLDTFTHTALYSQLLDLIPAEWVWGGVAIAFGVLTLFGLARHLPKTLFYGAGASGIHWFIISIFYFLGDITNTGGITALFISVLSIYIYLNCKLNWEHNRRETIEYLHSSDD
jgi:hypothetical protein